jgi:tetratricopeptide (TPR) repeat protein
MEALRLAELYKGDRSKARALFQLASLKSQQNDVEGVRKLFQMALPFYEKGGYRKELFALYVLLERAEIAAGAYDTAQQRLGELQKIASDQQSHGQVEEDLGSVFSDLQNYPEALRHYDESYKTYKALDAKLAMAYSATNRALQLSQLGQYETARAALDEALTVAQPPGRDPNARLLAFVYATRGRMALSTEDFKNSIADSDKALEVSAGKYKSLDVRAGFTAGLAEARSGRAESGRKKCEAALMLARTLSNYALLSQALLAAAESALLAGDSQAALSNAVEAQQRLTAAQQHEGEWLALALQALAVAKSGDHDRAHELAEKARTSLSSLEQQWGSDSYHQYLARKDIRSVTAKLPS